MLKPIFWVKWSVVRQDIELGDFEKSELEVGLTLIGTLLEELQNEFQTVMDRYEKLGVKLEDVGLLTSLEELKETQEYVDALMASKKELLDLRRDAKKER